MANICVIGACDVYVMSMPTLYFVQMNWWTWTETCRLHIHFKISSDFVVWKWHTLYDFNLLFNTFFTPFSMGCQTDEWRMKNEQIEKSMAHFINVHHL